MKTCTFPLEIMKQGAQSLWIKMETVELYLKEATCTVIYGFHPLAARLSKLASKLEDWTAPTCSTQARRKLSTDYSLGER